MMNTGGLSLRRTQLVEVVKCLLCANVGLDQCQAISLMAQTTQSQSTDTSDPNEARGSFLPDTCLVSGTMALFEVYRNKIYG